MKIVDILKNSEYSLAQFASSKIQKLEEKIITEKIREKEIPYIVCIIREKKIKLTPEEITRQLYLHVLLEEYGYSKTQIRLEYPVHFGREVKRADIVIMEKNSPTTPYIVVELKKIKLQEGKEQLKSYCNATGAPIAIWSNGEQTKIYHRKDPNYFEEITTLPTYNQNLEDIFTIKIDYKKLKEIDKIANQKISLKNLIKEVEDEVLAASGVDSFEEIFKLLFTKLYDEQICANDTTAFLQFRNYGETDNKLKEKIQKLFEKACDKWQGIFPESSKILLTPSHLAVCIGSLQDIKLFNNNLDVVDDAFEYLMSKAQKGEKGQYFTPRYVIDMCVKMLNPKENETMIDTAAGSSGFTIHTIFHVWRQIRIGKGIDISDIYTAENKTPDELDYVRKNVFSIDFDEKTVRVGRTLNLIAGDGQTNVLHLNTLDYDRWDENAKNEHWNDTYNEGFKELKKHRANKDSYDAFNFDILMANPPFAGDIKDGKIITRYELGKNAKGKWQSKVGRDVLFIERNLNFLKPGGRMAIVLPQGRFNNSTDRYIRDYIAEHCRILAVVGLHGNVFKPHTGTKTSVLFVQKWDDELCPKKEDYPIFFATMQESSKDNSGEKIYVKDEKGNNILDNHGHLIVKHDLFNHDGLTQDGITEAFEEFAKKERLSFF